ncbi:hypothetical protein HPL003_01245 [Paenibacillus terrae HPL-003]|uniref:Uncharacterized protein n=1 Tax=Paenibacillus terrae (strain HPL-003) TaxID=985665 RepID=G7VVJ9_PAETH|nr:hypothetical protein HPL003_01245 [Paenibacillus terrae HPL-003]
MKKINLFQFIIIVFMIFGGYVPLMDYLNHKSFGIILQHPMRE